MESLTALGLAANIVQFVDLSTRLLAEASEVYHSATGLSKEYVELRDVADNLKSMVECLVAPNDPGPSSSAQTEISKIALSAKAVAKDLIRTVETLKVSDGSKKGWQSFRQALSTLWNKDKIESLQKRLDAFRDQLSIQILAHVSTVQNSLVVEFQDLNRRCEELNSTRKISVDHIMISLQNMDGSIENMTKLSLDKLDDMLKEVKLSLEIYNKERQILESLQFDAMRHRYHAIAEAHRRTFNWIFEPEYFALSDPRSEIRFKDWLTFETVIYWISGKPGSGKSTLMKHICESAQTQTRLERWAQNDRLATAAFYFWASGSGMQRSQRGLFQQLLFEILRACPDFIPVLCAERWARDPCVDWSLPDLQTAFERLGNLVGNTKICFFIDGLDEYDGDHLELVNILQNVSSAHNIKLCISSRPWPVFEDAFGHHLGRKLCLEHLTVDDISRFAREKLEEIPGFAILRQERQIYSDLVLDMSRKAQGVFLWVFLVVKSLREGLVNGDNLSVLRQRVDAMPSDLEAFFDKLIHSVDKVYQNHMAMTLDVAIRSPNSLNMLTYWFLDGNNCHSQYPPSLSKSLDVYFIEDQMTRKLSGCYKGLLEGIGPIGCRKVDFVHRTVRDYLSIEQCPTFSAKSVSPRAQEY